MATSTLLDDVLELAALLTPSWTQISSQIPAWHPRCEGDDADSADGDTAAAGAAAAGADNADDADDNAGDNDDADDDTGATRSAADKDDPNDPAFLKRMGRKHEREAKKARAERDAALKKLKEREDADKSEHERAIEAARADGENAALSKYEEQRRDDKLETETVKLALKDLTIGSGDKAKKARFADADDAHLRLERAIRRGELSYDDIYEDGKVKRDALTDFLRELLQDNPHLQAKPAGAASNGDRGGVDYDGGKGKGSGSKDLDDLSPADHLKEIQRR